MAVWRNESPGDAGGGRARQMMLATSQDAISLSVQNASLDVASCVREALGGGGGGGGGDGGEVDAVLRAEVRRCRLTLSNSG